MDHSGTFLCGAYRIFRNVGFCIAQFQIVTCVKHTAVGISAVVKESAVQAGLFGSSAIHHRTIKMFG